jgi:hypothetical protein
MGIVGKTTISWLFLLAPGGRNGDKGIFAGSGVTVCCQDYSLSFDGNILDSSFAHSWQSRTPLSGFGFTIRAWTKLLVGQLKHWIRKCHSS